MARSGRARSSCASRPSGQARRWSASERKAGSPAVVVPDIHTTLLACGAGGSSCGMNVVADGLGDHQGGGDNAPAVGVDVVGLSVSLEQEWGALP